MISIGIIAYDTPHLKTEQVLMSLINQPVAMTLYLLPFTPRKAREPLICHRPDQTAAVHPRVLAKAHGLKYIPCVSDADIANGMDLYLLTGAGILSAECVKGKKIVNAHPGVIPAVRGLDAFKWAIYENKPLGVTLHTIDAQVDKGDVISIRKTCVYDTDTIDTLARRHYENEIDMMRYFLEFINNPVNDFINIEIGAAHMRMKREDEECLLEHFAAYVERFAEGGSSTA